MAHLTSPLLGPLPPLVHLRFPTPIYLESLLFLFCLAPHPTLARLGAPTHPLPSLWGYLPLLAHLARSECFFLLQLLS